MADGHDPETAPGAGAPGAELPGAAGPFVGRSVRRTEDRRFLTGTGHYLDDDRLPGEARAVVLRSPHAHAVIRSIDVREAKAMPGVVAVLTGEDVLADGLAPLPCWIRIPLKKGTSQAFPDRPALAVGRVRFVGDPIAMIVAETLEAARDAAERIAVDYDPLPAVVDLAAAVAPGAPLVHDDAAGNVDFVFEAGDRAATDDAFARAATVVSLDLVNNRVAPTPLEPRGAIGSWSEAEGYTLRVSSQGSHWIKDTLTGYVFKDVPPDKVRVITPDVGGGFGTKLFLTPEYLLVLWAARRTGRPVRWIADRSEGFLADTHGRDNLTHAELALDSDGCFLGLRMENLANMGAYLSEFGPTIPTADRMQEGAYAIPSVHILVKGVFTHTGPVDAYRGAGRPEALYMIERLVDRAGRITGLGPAEIRRRNFIPAAAMPYENRLGHRFDSGDFQRLLAEALRDADAEGFAARRAAAEDRGRLRGLGIASYVNVCAGEPPIQAMVQLDEGDVVTVTVGTHSNGQGHETAYAQIVADRLGVAFDRVRVRQGDTAWLPAGSVTAGSRSIPVGGVATVIAADEAVEDGRAVAAVLLEADGADIAYGGGTYRVAGTDRTVSLFTVAEAARRGHDGLPMRTPAPLRGEGAFDPPAGTYTNGCHAAEVEVDPETGAVRICRYTAVDDFGRLVNPALVAGQVAGGVAQGIGQALMESVRYDAASGQLLSATLLDYALPRAGDLPAFGLRTIEIPCLTNPLGLKGVGESGAVAAPPAIVNAVLDALAPLGVEGLDMPLTPDTVWAAIAAARPPY